MVRERRPAPSPRPRRSRPWCAPAPRAASSAATTYGVRPLALSPTTASRGVDAQRMDGGGAGVPVVLCLLLRGRGRGRAAGDQGDDAPGGTANVGLALGGVDDSEPAGRPRADVDEAAARCEPLGNCVDRRGDRSLPPARPPREPPRRPRSSARRARRCSGGRDPRPTGRGPPSRARRRPSPLPFAPSRRPVYARDG